MKFNDTFDVQSSMNSRHCYALDTFIHEDRLAAEVAAKQEEADRLAAEVAAKEEEDRLAAEVAAKQAEVAEEALLVFLRQEVCRGNGTAPAAARLQRQLLPTVNSDV